MASKLKKAPKSSRKVANEALAQSSAERAFSGAWGTHNDKRFRRNRTRIAQKRNATNEQLS